MQDLDVIFSTPMDSYIRGSVSGLPAVFKGILTHLPWQARGSVLFFIFHAVVAIMGFSVTLVVILQNCGDSVDWLLIFSVVEMSWSPLLHIFSNFYILRFCGMQLVPRSVSC